MRSPVASSPQRPQKCTLPPRREMATAAEADMPPPTSTQSLAGTLIPLVGISSSLNSMSQVTMPRQRRGLAGLMGGPRCTAAPALPRRGRRRYLSPPTK